MEKAIFFDSGPVISLTMNNLLWLLEDLKKNFNGKFYITPAVYKELVRKPIETKRFKFEALQILPLITKGVLEVYRNKAVQARAEQIMNLTNNAFKTKGKWMKLVHFAEAEVVAAALVHGTDTVVIDERTTRHFIEDPLLVKNHIERKMHHEISSDNKNVDLIKKEFKNLKVIRSLELVTMGYELGLLDKYIAKGEKDLIPNPKKELLEGALWAIKLGGCSVREQEIKDIIKSEFMKK